MPIRRKMKFDKTIIIYSLIAVVCIIAVGAVVYTQFFKEEKLGVIFGISSDNNDEEYANLKQNFFDIFDNQLDIIKEYSGTINKIKGEGDIIYQAHDISEQKEKYTLDVKIAYLNINSDVARKINKEINSIFKQKSDSIIATAKNSTVYNVRYKAYLNNNILSLIIASELKEGNSSERIIIETYNYNLQTNKEVTINEILQEKNIDIDNANRKIREEIKSSQEHNIKLAELGYKITIRDADSDIYKIENAKQFFIGGNGYVYIIYPYGNNEFTSDVDVVIFN